MKKAPKPAEATDQATQVPTQKEIAAELGVTPSTVNENPRIAKTSSGKIDVTRTADIHDAILKRERAVGSMRELEYRQKAGELVEIVMVERTFTTATKVITDSLLSLPDKMAPLLASITDVRQLRELLSAEIRQTLSSLPTDIGAAVRGKRFA
jgi:hypothetical protein